MSLWHCAEHGLYGGTVLCPECGKVGSHAEIADDPTDRHAWDDLKEECQIRAKWDDLDGKS